MEWRSRLFIRALATDEPHLARNGWTRACAWQRTCGGVTWAWFEKDDA